MSEILTERELALICAVQESTDGKYNRYSHEYAVATIGKLLGCIAGLREKLAAAEARLGEEPREDSSQPRSARPRAISPAADSIAE